MSLIKHLTSRKYRVFARKIKDVEVAIWELDFKVAKSRQVREGVRQDRERMVESLQIIVPAIERETDVEKKKALQDQEVACRQNIERYESQMQMIDKQINGYTRQKEEEESVIGLHEQIASYAELREMYKSYLKTI